MGKKSVKTINTNNSIMSAKLFLIMGRYTHTKVIQMCQYLLNIGDNENIKKSSIKKQYNTIVKDIRYIKIMKNR